MARLNDPSLLPGSDPAAHVFIPDTHIVPADDIKLWPGRVMTPSRFEQLSRLLDVLQRLRQTDPTLSVWQLGDLVDLWRIGDSPFTSLERRIKRAMTDWGPLLSRLAGGGPLGLRRLFGNHDVEMRAFRNIVECAFVPPDPGDTTSNDMLVIHGHQYDDIELLPARLKADIMRGFTQRVSSYTMDLVLSQNPHWSPLPPDYTFTLPPQPSREERGKFLSPDLKLDDPVPTSVDRWNVREVALTYDPAANPMMSHAFEDSVWHDTEHPALWDGAKRQARKARGAGYSVAVVVVGHTHNARIVVGRFPDGQRVAMMDCGGWIGPRFLAPALKGAIHNCTIGVRVGADLRIYQLGRDPYRWPN